MRDLPLLPGAFSEIIAQSGKKVSLGYSEDERQVDMGAEQTEEQDISPQKGTGVA